ncbi:MAG: Z-ring formation inhibitor MciZ [Clostridiales bacterium]
MKIYYQYQKVTFLGTAQELAQYLAEACSQYQTVAQLIKAHLH